MKCHFCDESATVHLTEIVQLQKTELHLCERCAQKHQVLGPPAHELNVQAILKLLLGQSPADHAPRLTCPECGLQYEEFRVTGRLGCPHDYDAFRAVLLPLLERIHVGGMHQGAGRHHGKQPGRAAPDDIDERLRDAVHAERYEEAARLRDLIRRKDASDDELG